MIFRDLGLQAALTLDASEKQRKEKASQEAVIRRVWDLMAAFARGFWNANYKLKKRIRKGQQQRDIHARERDEELEGGEGGITWDAAWLEK
jgi:hypothetical protein